MDAEANVRQLRLTIKHRHICIFTEESLTLEAQIIARQFKNRSENNLHILVAGGTGLHCYGGLYAAGIGGSADRNTNWYNIDMYGHGVRLYFGSSEKNTKWNGEIRATGGKTARASVPVGTEPGNISTSCPVRSPQRRCLWRGHRRRQKRKRKLHQRLRRRDRCAGR